MRKQEERKRVRAERAKRRRREKAAAASNDSSRESGGGGHHQPATEQCIICLHSYPTRNQVGQCMRRHEEELQLDVAVRCPLCFADIQSKRLVTQHFAEVHIGQGTTCCPECLLVMPNENNRLRR